MDLSADSVYGKTPKVEALATKNFGWESDPVREFFSGAWYQVEGGKRNGGHNQVAKRLPQP